MTLTFEGTKEDASNEMVMLRVKDADTNIKINMWNYRFRKDFEKNQELALELASQIVPRLTAGDGIRTVTIGDSELIDALTKLGAAKNDHIWPR